MRYATNHCRAGVYAGGPMGLGLGVGGEAEDVKQGGRGLHKMEEFGDD